MGGIKFPSLKGVGKSLGQEVFGGIVHAFGGGKRAESAARNIGGEIGSAGGEVATPLIGAALMAKTGGKVPGKRGKAKLVLAHSGETILPLNTRPTKNQLKVIRKNQKRKGLRGLAKTTVIFH